MAWIWISIVVEQDRVPLLEAALENAGALAVTLGDVADELQFEQPPDTTPLWGRVRLTALYPDQPQALATALALFRSLAAHLSAEPRLERVEDRIWERAWLDDFAPARFGRRLWIYPRGQSAEDPDAVVVKLDPGLAFGTGRHPTTALCLRWLEGAELKGKTVKERLSSTTGVAQGSSPSLHCGSERPAQLQSTTICKPWRPPEPTRSTMRSPTACSPTSRKRCRKRRSTCYWQTSWPARCSNSRLGWRHWCASGDGSSWQAFFVTRTRKSRQPTHLGLGWTRPGPWTNGCW